MSQPVAVLFDLDGVLVDSEPIWFDVETRLVEGMGGTWGPEHQARCIGGTVDGFCRYVLELTGADRTAADLEAEVLHIMAARFTEALTVHEGALELVDAVRERGARTALVTSSYRALVDPALRWLGAHRFDAVVTGDEVNRGKPDPEPYLTACAALDLRPEAVVVVEDSSSGVASAQAAGCTVVVVPGMSPVPSAPGRHLVAGMGDIDVDWLLALPASLRRDGLQDVEA